MTHLTAIDIYMYCPVHYARTRATYSEHHREVKVLTMNKGAPAAISCEAFIRGNAAAADAASWLLPTYPASSTVFMGLAGT